MDQHAMAARASARPAAPVRAEAVTGPADDALTRTAGMLDAARPVQRLQAMAASLEPRGATAPIQLRRVDPAVTGGAALAGPVDAPNTDSVAPGTRTLAAYTATIQAPAASQAAAMVDARGEYRSIGAGLTDAHRFLCEASLRQQINAQRPVAARVFEIFAEHDLVWAPPMEVMTPQAKQAAVQQFMQGGGLTPANLDLLRNAPDIMLKDPLKVTIVAPYGAAQQLSLTADFTEGQKGYISTVQDTGTNTAARIMDRPNYAGEFPDVPAPDVKAGATRALHKEFITDQGAQVGTIATFSNVHHTATQEDAATQIGRLGTATTRAHLEGGVDAVTKVVAEGGRFRCVAALGTAIRSDSLFYASHDGGFREIAFRDLWKLWTRRFAGVYGVTDLSVTTFLRLPDPLGGAQQVAVEPAATGYNYDVANSAVR